MTKPRSIHWHVVLKLIRYFSKLVLEDCFIKLLLTLYLQLIMMLIGVPANLHVNLSQVIVFSLVILLFLGSVRNSKQYLNPLQRPSTGVWLMCVVNSLG